MSRLVTLKYSLKTSLLQVSPYYLTIAALFALYLILNLSTSGSLGSWDALACFVATALPSGFKERFHFFLQNGYSRKTIFLNFLACFVLIAVFMSVFEIVLVELSVMTGVNYQPIFQDLYAARYILDTSNIIFENFLWHASIFLAFMCISFPLCIGYYRMSKTLRVIVCIVIPTALFIGLPILDLVLADGSFLAEVFVFIVKMLGLYEGCNPLIATASFSVISIIGIIISYFLIKRTNITK